MGRAPEFRRLLKAAWLPPAVALVEGEAGVGKTRLVQELLAARDLRGRRCFIGGCQQLAEPFPLGPVVDALREARPATARLSPAVGALRPLLAELSPILPAPPDPLGDPRAERHRLFRGLREFLGALGPSVLVLEDLHWADDTTLDLLRFLVPQLPPELTLVCTYRREELTETSPLLGLAARLPAGTSGAQVTLNALDRSQVRELAGTILDVEEVSEEFAGYLFDGSGGLPFAVEELLRLLEDRQDLVRRRGLWVRRDLEQLGVPTALRDSILERLGRLRPGARSVVRSAAVVGLPADERLLARVAGLPEGRARGALTQAVSAALLIEAGEGRYAFRHALARQAVEEAIPGPLRRGLHLRAAVALRSVRPEPLARLAHHYRAAGKVREWIRFAEAAADRAKSLEDDATAYQFLKQAVVVPNLSPTTRARLAIKLGTHARHCLAHGEAIELLRALLEDEKLPRSARGELRMRRVKLLSLEGDTTPAQSEAVRAVDELSRRPALAAEAMVYVALLAFVWGWAPEGSIEERLNWLDRAARTADRSHDRAAKMSVAGHRAVFLLAVGDPRGWDEAKELPPPRGEAEADQARRVYNNLADPALHLGHYRRAELLIRESRRLMAQTPHSYAPFAVGTTELQLRWLIGDWADLEHAARAHVEARGDCSVLRHDVEAVLALLLLARGEVHVAHRMLARLAEDFRGEGPVLGWVSAALARLRLAEGAPEEAADQVERTLDPLQRMGMWVWATDVAPVRVESLLGTARRDEAADLTRRFARGLEGKDAPAASAALVVCRGLLLEASGDRGSAARTFLDAERRWRSLPRPYEAARAREHAGRCLLPETQGTTMLAEAIDAFRALGAAWDAARVRSTLLKHDAIPPHRGGRKSYGVELSPRESQVARLACDGMTNREIAVALFLARKTVEGHLHSTMRKLGVTSRAEIAARLPAHEARPSQPFHTLAT